MGDRTFTIAFSVSLGLHVLLLTSQLLSLRWLSPPRRPIEVIYERQAAEDALRVLQEQLARAQRSTAASPAPSLAAAQPQIRIPDRAAVALEPSDLTGLPERAAVIDLTNLVDAARGDPVLLSYFSAIRERIQRTANGQAWLSAAAAPGLVYVSFFLSASGAAQRIEVLSDRSAPVDALRDVAVRIVRQSSPFPAFPPSMAREQGKTIIVPLEFLLGS